MIGRWRKKARPDAGLITPPEGVPLRLPIAALGARAGAQVTDILLTGLGSVAFLVLLVWLNIVEPLFIVAVGMLLFFVIRIPYYVLTELMWNGQTLGKRLMSIKVVSHSGGPLQTHALVLRNLMKEAEVFLPGTLLMTLDKASPVASWLALAWVVAVLLVPLSNPYRMRLGDIMAGTHVISLPQPILLKDVATAEVATETSAEFAFMTHQLDHYGAFELQTLESLLQRAEATSTARQDETYKAIVENIRKKIGYAEPVVQNDRRAFLTAFYKAQREHLEQRQIFGERRADKFHSGSDT